ncbi:MAG: GC-type dockerin domain-anchored protein [Phycisphaerales bacterium]
MPASRTSTRLSRTALLPAILLAAHSSATVAQERLHYTYLWHLEQPIYWPDQQTSGADRYERAWESIQRKSGGAVHPQNNLSDIFGLADRVAAYQYRVRDSISAISGHPEAGAQISYSGGLIANITSLGNASQLGYSPNWFASYREARNWFSASADPAKRKPRCDIVLFSFHHALLPLVDENTVRKEIQLYKAVYPQAWGATPGLSRGIFPSEMAFSTRLIKPFVEEGIAWTFVSGEKISRACGDFPVILGSGGVNCNPPNRADQINPDQGAGNYLRLQIDRGCSPAEAYPYAFTPQRARYVDPATGAVYSMIVVPCSQSLGWKDGYAPLGLSDFNTLQTRNDPSRPMLVVLAHDGDNAWGGGYSYYLEATPNLANAAASAQYVPTTVERYLADHSVPAGAYVHVEDGAWVNADGDFGAPQFLNWNWPLVNSSGQVDIPGGWAEDERNWAVITAAQNRVETAEQMTLSAGGSVNIQKILNPDASTNRAERAWHYFLGSLNSGYMYYGTALDMEVKPTIACNEAVEHADVVINNPPGGATDTTAPTIWLPQRWPWNPGSVNFGPAHGYRQVVNNGDFWVWTFVHDVSGIPAGGVTFKYRIDADGQRPPIGAAATDNETYAGGPGVGPWQSLAMTKRLGGFPAGNFHNDPTIDFFEMPQYIADQYHVQVTGLRSVLIDYYVEAVDTLGNIKRSPIQHVWIGDGQGATPGGPAVTLTPEPAVAGQSATVAYNPAGRPLAGAASVRAHIGFNNWQTVVSPDLVLTWNASTSRWEGTFTVSPSATQADFAFNNGSGTWDNNGGTDWHFVVTGGNPNPSGSCCVGSSCSLTVQAVCSGAWAAGGACTPNPCSAPPPSFVMDGVLDPGTVQVAVNGGVWLRAALRGNTLYVAALDAGEGNDHFILFARPPATPGAMRSAPWAKAGQAAQWDLFLADENDNDYESWFDSTGSSTSASVQAATGANGGVLEGTIDLVTRFGTLPERVALAFTPYGNANGGSLMSAFQCPASVNGDGNLDAAEFVIVELCSLRTPPSCCAADFNGSGGLSVQDIFDYLAAYFADQPAADFNGSGGLSVQDIFDYLAAYFAGSGC